MINLNYAFCNCFGLTGLSMENRNTSKVMNAYNMFYRYNNLCAITLGPKIAINVIKELLTPRSFKLCIGKRVC